MISTLLLQKCYFNVYNARLTLHLRQEGSIFVVTVVSVNPGKLFLTNISANKDFRSLWNNKYSDSIIILYLSNKADYIFLAG